MEWARLLTADTAHGRARCGNVNKARQVLIAPWSLYTINRCGLRGFIYRLLLREHNDLGGGASVLLTSSHFINLLPLLRLSGTDTGLSCSAWTPGCAPAIGSSTLLDARPRWKMVSVPFSPAPRCPPLRLDSAQKQADGSPLLLLLLLLLLPDWHARSDGSSGASRLWRAVEAGASASAADRRNQTDGLADWLTEWHAAEAKTTAEREKEREREK